MEHIWENDTRFLTGYLSPVINRKENLMDNIYSKFTCRLIDEHLVSDPTQVKDIDHICDMNDIQTTVCKIFEQHFRV